MRRHSAEPGYERLPLEKLFDDIATEAHACAGKRELPSRGLKTVPPGWRNGSSSVVNASACPA